MGMSKEGASHSVVELLIREAWDLLREDRYDAGLAAARKAVDAARELRDLALEVRATDVEAAALGMLGDRATALVRYTWILALAEDPEKRAALGDADLTWEFAEAYMNWVECGRFLPETPVRKLFDVLDAGEAWLRSAGRPEWRSGLLSQRASLLESQGRHEEAVGYAEEAVSLRRQHPNTPGYTLATYLWKLGTLLRELDRTDEAEGYYQEVLDDSASHRHDRFAALNGLARCALARDDAAAARRHAESALRLAEGMGDNVLCGALDALIAACRAAGDLDAAAQAADRHLEAARRVSGIRIYFALRDAADVALDRGDAAAARRHLDEAAPIAEALDRQRDVETFANEMAKRRRRLAELASEGAPGA